MGLTTLAGFTGIDRAYIGDYTTAIAQATLLALFVYADAAVEGEELVMVRLLLFTAIAVWWIIDIIQMGYMVSTPGTHVKGGTSQWNSPIPTETEAVTVVAILFSVLVHVIPQWAPIKMQTIKN